MRFVFVKDVFSKCEQIRKEILNGKLNILCSQKQPSRGVLIKRFSANMQEIYRRTPMLKCDLHALKHGCSPVNFLHIFRTPFFL